VEPAPDNDEVLKPYLWATAETEASALEHLVCKLAHPLINEVIRSKLRVGHLSSSDITDDEASELVSEVTIKLLGRLRELKSDTDRPISNFRGYVAVSAYHTCDEFLRKKYPRRYSLKNQLRYVLTHSRGLAIWTSEDQKQVCGFSEWAQLRHSAIRAGLRESLSQSSQLPTTLTSGKFTSLQLIAEIFDRNGAPLTLDDLVTIVAELAQIKDNQPQISIDDDYVGSYAVSRQEADMSIDQRSQVERLWLEVCALPLRQRVALLLSLRDANGRAVLTLLPLIGIASLRQLADALEMPADKLAELWNKLPLEDTTIAESLRVTRQQVINLRKSARSRLARRTRK
jgi:hypothetical protein